MASASAKPGFKSSPNVYPLFDSTHDATNGENTHWFEFGDKKELYSLGAYRSDELYDNAVVAMDPNGLVIARWDGSDWEYQAYHGWVYDAAYVTQQELLSAKAAALTLTRRDQKKIRIGRWGDLKSN